MTEREWWSVYRRHHRSCWYWCHSKRIRILAGQVTWLTNVHATTLDEAIDVAAHEARLSTVNLFARKSGDTRDIEAVCAP